MIDIRYGQSDQFNILSNLADKPFVFDGRWVRTVEGVLQAIKTSDVTIQKQFFVESGHWCKKHGRALEWRHTRILWWNGVPMDRDSEEYQHFLDRLYATVYSQSEQFRAALMASKGCELAHTIGAVDPEYTILTADEFVSRLDALRQLNKKGA